jgi:hypothetical protein
MTKKPSAPAEQQVPDHEEPRKAPRPERFVWQDEEARSVFSLEDHTDSPEPHQPKLPGRRRKRLKPCRP